MDFKNQQQVVMLRNTTDLAWWEIRKRVVNRQNKWPSEKQCREVYEKFDKKLGLKPYNYKKCGRKVSKLTPAVAA